MASSLTVLDMRHVESVLGMGEGYVLDLNDQTALLGRKFNPTLFDTLAINGRVGKVLAERMAEAQLCLQAGANLAAVILSGSVLEGLCLGVGQRRADQVKPVFRERFRRDPPALEEWTLNQWIGVFRHLEWFSPTTEKFAHSLREFRNYIHPGAQTRVEHSPNHHAALIAFQVVVAAAEELSRMQAAKESQGNG